jgi:tetratricopeptide (TPR) repeat protein
MLEVGVRDVEAFIYYQRATELFFDAHTNQIDMKMLGDSAGLYDRAIELEPRFAAAYHMRSDYSAHRMTMIGPTAEERAAAAERHAADLAQAVRYARNPHARALIEVDQTLTSDNWRPVRARLEAALASPTCDEGTWVEVAPVFGYAQQTLDRALRMIACDPLNFYNHYQASMALFLLDRQEEAIEAAERGLEVAPNHPFIESLVVKALMAQGRLDEALAKAETITSWSRDGTVAGVLAAEGELEGAHRLIDRVIADAGPWQRNFLTASLAAIVGDRERANEAAAWYDGLPGGPLMLTGVIMECACGAPFDIEVTPNLRRRLAEAGVDWPPPTILDYPAMREARGQP